MTLFSFDMCFDIFCQAKLTFLPMAVKSNNMILNLLSLRSLCKCMRGGFLILVNLTYRIVCKVVPCTEI